MTEPEPRPRRAIEDDDAGLGHESRNASGAGNGLGEDLGTQQHPEHDFVEDWQDEHAPAEQVAEADLPGPAMPGDVGYLPPVEPAEADVPPVPRGRPRGLSRVPLPITILGAVVLLALLVVGFFALRAHLQPDAGDGPAPAGAVTPDPKITLTPRAGTPAPLQHGQVGQRVNIDGLYGKGTVMVVSAEWSDRGDLAPGEGKKYLNVQLRYDCTEGSLFTSLNQVAAYDKAKTEYLPGIGSGKDRMADQEIKAGGNEQGWVSFEMPPGPALLVISDEGVNPLVVTEIDKP